LRLCAPPLPVAVRCNADGRPTWVQSAWAWGTLARVEGPERLGGEWWNDRYERDYYRIDWPGGERAWIFHDLLREAWFLHGLFD
jgi:protein ImuB